MIKKYKNELGQFITQQQIENLEFYDTIFYDEDHIKFIEKYSIYAEDDKSVIIEYFLDFDEDKSAIVDQLYQRDKLVESVVIYSVKEVSGNFSKWNYEYFRVDGTVRERGIEVFDAYNRTIFSGSLDLNTNTLLDGSSKNYYNDLSAEESEPFISFTYHADGTVNWVIDNEELYYIKGVSLEEFLANSEYSQVDFPWNNHPYYHSTYPFLPIGDL